MVISIAKGVTQYRIEVYHIHTISTHPSMGDIRYIPNINLHITTQVLFLEIYLDDKAPYREPWEQHSTCAYHISINLEQHYSNFMKVYTKGFISMHPHMFTSSSSHRIHTCIWTKWFLIHKHRNCISSEIWVCLLIISYSLWSWNHTAHAFLSCTSWAPQPGWMKLCTGILTATRT